MLVFSAQNTNFVPEARAVSRATTIVTSRAALNNGDCRLTMPVVKGRCDRDALPLSLNIDVFETAKNISTTTKHI